MRFAKKTVCTLLWVGLGCSALAMSQQPVLLTAIPDAPSAGSTPEPSAVILSPQPGTTAQRSAFSEKVDRWLDVDEMSFNSRYRSEIATDGYTFFANAQERSVVDGRVKLDATANYTLDFRVSSGRSFNWSYSNVINPDFLDREGPASLAVTPLPILQKLGEVLALGYPIPAVPSRGWEMVPRQLYLSATPVRWLTAEYGSLGIEKGKGSEITTYDDDGYLTGERLRLHDPKHLYFDQIAVTYAFEGDVFTPDFIDRTQHLKKSNYHQFLVSKDFSKRVGASTDYTFDKKTHTVREAAYIKLPETKIVDSLRAEFYQRLNTVDVGPLPFMGGSGFAFTAEKTFLKRVKMDGGYEQVDANYGATVDNVVGAITGFSMNGDSYSTGKHIFTHANVKLTSYASLSGFYIHQAAAFPYGEAGFVKQGFNGGLNIDLKKLVNSRQQIF